jgi:hypothetical protein
MKKHLMIFAVLFVVMAVLLLPMGVTADDTLDGTFSTNALPSVTVALETTAITPYTTQCSVTVGATDLDKLSDIATIVLKMWYDSDGGVPSETSEFDTATADTKNCAIITYTVATNTFVLTPSSSTTWTQGTCVPFDAGEKDTTTGDCVFVFTPGKVATQTTGSAVWQIAAKVTDSTLQDGWGYDNTPATMAWYGEVAVGPSGVNFGSIAAGTTFDECTPRTVFNDETTPTGVKYISNGAYDEQVKSSSTWSTKNLEISVKTPDTMTTETFSLKADDTATLSSAVMVDTSGAVIDNTGIQTTEDGDNITTNTLWLQLADTFAAGSYAGTITYIIASGS